jgi:hypothetical protein
MLIKGFSVLVFVRFVLPAIVEQRETSAVISAKASKLLENESQLSPPKANIPKTVLRAPTASGFEPSRIFFPLSMTSNEPPSDDIPVHALKYALTHSSKVSHLHFVISFLSTPRTALIPFNRWSNSSSFFWHSSRQRSEARVISRKPKNNCRISVNVKPSWRAR